MKKSVQAGKYIVSDFIASSVVWLLFNLIRYEEVAVYEGFDTVGAFLLHIPSLKGQLLIPFFWFVYIGFPVIIINRSVSRGLLSCSLPLGACRSVS